MRRSWRDPWILLTALLIILLGARLSTGTLAPILTATPARSPHLMADPTAPTVRAVTFEPIQQSALFYPARQFYVPPPVQAQLPKPNYRLTGSFVVADRPAIAMLTPMAGGAARKVSPGADLDGWTVLFIEASRVMLRLNDQMIEITSRGNAESSAPGTAPSTLNAVTGNGHPPSGLTRVTIGTPPIAASASSVRVLAASRSVRAATGRGPGQQMPADRSRLFQPPPH